MTVLMQQTFDKILLLSEEKQNTLATYLQNHMDDKQQKAEKEKRIREGTYIIDDFNEETQQAIRNIEEFKNLTVCENPDDLYKKLGISGKYHDRDHIFPNKI